MHYYQFNIGDYASHTRHLNLLEDLAYRRLLDIYYLQERPLNVGVASVARQINMRDHEVEVKAVLEEFFELTDEGWINRRADQEIAKYQEFIAAGRRGAAKRWAKATVKGGESEANGEANSPPNATPIVNNKHKPITIVEAKKPKQPRGARLPADWVPSEELIAFCKTDRPDLNPAAVADRFRDFWIAQPGTKGVKLDWDATWRNWVRNEKAGGGTKAAAKTTAMPDWASKRATSA
jgi:uncharacterized protein YdaU (DUF1376 family)